MNHTMRNRASESMFLTLCYQRRLCVYIYNGILLNHKKKNGIVSFAEMWMDLETVIQSETGQKEKNTYHTLMYICEI